MPRKQSTARKTGTVQKFIGTAYDEMKTLYDNLDYLLSLEDSLEELKWYLGATTIPPTEQSDGSPLIDGNYYFNPETNALGFYDVAQTMWVYISPEELEQLMLTTIANKEASDVSAANALASENAALVSQQAAFLSEMNAGISAADALVSETNAASSEQTSDAHRIAAEASENASKASETASAQSASDALQSENNAETYKNQAAASKDAAAVSEANAAADAIRAENAATVAESALVPKGDWDASGGVFPVPTIRPTERSDFYQIAVAGTMSDGVQDDVTVAVGDQLYWHVDRDVWYKIDNTDQVTSVNNRKGAVVVTKIDVGLSEVVNQGQSDSYTTTTATHASTKAVVDAHAKLDGEKLDKTANAVSATRLKDPFKIGFLGDAVGEATLDGSGDVNVSMEVQDNSHSHDASTITGLANKAETVDQKGVLIPSTLSEDAPVSGEEAFIFFDENKKEFVGFNPKYKELGSIGGSGIPAYSVIAESVKSYLFDGVDDYISIPQVDLVSGDTVSFKFVATDTSSTGFKSLFGGVGTSTDYLSKGSDNTWRVYQGSASLDGVAIVHGVTPFPDDGLEHIVVWTTGTFSLGVIGARGDFQNECNFPIFDVDIQAASGNRFYPINDGWSANPVIADSLNPQSSQPELVTNGTFDSNTSNWDTGGNSATVVNGKLRLAGNSNATQRIDVNAGLTYTVTWDISDTTGGNYADMRVGTANGTWDLYDGGNVGDGSYSITFTATTGDAFINLKSHAASGDTGLYQDWDNVSVKEYTHGTAENFNEENWVSKNEFTVEAGEGVRIDTAALGADTTVNLPTLADGTREGDFVSVGYKGLATHEITLVSQDFPFMDMPLGTPLTLNGDYSVYTLSLSGGEWAIVNAVGESGSTPVIRNKVEQVFPAGTSAFSLAYDVGYVDVFLEGLKLDDTSILAVDGETVHLVDTDGNPMPLLEDTHVLVQAWNHAEVTDLSSGMIGHDSTGSDIDANTVKEALDIVTKKSELLDKVLTEYANPNLLINGDLLVWQRGTSGANSASFEYTADRMGLWAAGANTNWSRVASTEFGDFASEVAWGLRSSPDPVSTQSPFQYRMENQDCYHLLGKTVTFSFLMNSTVTQDVEVEFATANAFEDFTGITNFYTETVSVGSTTQRVVVTTEVTASTVRNGLSLVIRPSNSGGSSVAYSNLKLELGSVATPFVPDSPQVNLAKCQRYYYQKSQGLYLSARVDDNQVYRSLSITHPVTMRIVPALDYQLSNAVINTVAGDDIGFTLTANATSSSHGATLTNLTANAEL